MHRVALPADEAWEDAAAAAAVVVVVMPGEAVLWYRVRVRAHFAKGGMGFLPMHGISSDKAGLGVRWGRARGLREWAAAGSEMSHVEMQCFFCGERASIQAHPAIHPHGMMP